MPEAPDLHVIREILTERIAGREVTAARVLRSTVLRSLASRDFPSDIVGRSVGSIDRRGKYLLLSLSRERMMAINPMLTGALQLCPSSERVYKRTCIVLTFAEDLEIRYIDDRQMGRVYYVSPDQLDQVHGDMKPGLTHIAFTMPDIEDASREVTDQGIESRHEPFLQPRSGRTIFTFGGPDGIMLQFARKDGKGEYEDFQ